MPRCGALATAIQVGVVRVRPKPHKRTRALDTPVMERAWPVSGRHQHMTKRGPAGSAGRSKTNAAPCMFAAAIVEKTDRGPHQARAML